MTRPARPSSGPSRSVALATSTCSFCTHRMVAKRPVLTAGGPWRTQLTTARSVYPHGRIALKIRTDLNASRSKSEACPITVSSMQVPLQFSNSALVSAGCTLSWATAPMQTWQSRCATTQRARRRTLEALLLRKKGSAEAPVTPADHEHSFKNYWTRNHESRRRSTRSKSIRSTHARTLFPFARSMALSSRPTRRSSGRCA
jgi:hypothetical protein